MCIAATDERSGGEQGGDFKAGGSGADRALPQSSVLQRRSLLQQSELIYDQTSDFTLGGVRLKENISIVTFLLFQHEIAIVTEEGVEIIGPLSSETNWDIAHMVRLGFVVVMVTTDCGSEFSLAAVCWGDNSDQTWILPLCVVMPHALFKLSMFYWLNCLQ